MKEEEEEVRACCSSKGSVTLTYYSFGYLHGDFLFFAVCHYDFSLLSSLFLIPCTMQPVQFHCTPYMKF